MNSIEKKYVTGGQKLFIFFGGIQAGIAMPPFEFYSASKILSENKIFLRDFEQCWYQNGLEGIGDNIECVVNFLKEEISRLQPRSVTFVGNSMGGFAAIMFSSLVGVGETIAFAPQTFLSEKLRSKYSDIRWAEQVAKAQNLSAGKLQCLDLKPLLLSSQNKEKVFVYVSSDDKLDQMHAKHLEDIGNVEVFEFSEGGHELVQYLKKCGFLPDILAGEFDPA